MLIGIAADHANQRERTGVGNVCLALIQELKKQIPVSEQVILYSAGPLSPELADLPAHWRLKILRWPLGKLWTQLRLSWEFIFRPPDVFLAPGQLLPVICPQKTVAIVHDSAFLAVPLAYRFWGRQYLKWMNRLIIRKAWKIITASKFNKREIAKYYGRKAEEKTIVVPFAYDQKIFYSVIAPGADDPYARYGISKPYVMYIGRLETKKNTANLVRAFDILKSDFDIQLFLAGGPGAGFRATERMIKDSLYASDIICPGWVAGQDLRRLLQKALVFVFPSLYEGFGLPILEAMASGCPVVAAGMPALREVGGEAALYTDDNSAEKLAGALAGVLADSGLREKMRLAGLERAKNFSWSDSSARILAVLIS